MFSVVVAVACPRARWTVTTTQRVAMSLEVVIRNDLTVSSTSTDAPRSPCRPPERCGATACAASPISRTCPRYHGDSGAVLGDVPCQHPSAPPWIHRAQAGGCQLRAARRISSTASRSPAGRRLRWSGTVACRPHSSCLLMATVVDQRGDGASHAGPWWRTSVTRRLPHRSRRPRRSCHAPLRVKALAHTASATCCPSAMPRRLSSSQWTPR